MEIPKLMIKCCRWCCRTNVIVLIWVSVDLSFHKCLCVLHPCLYTVSPPRVSNDAGIVAHICYISLLRCNYYHKYLACEEEDLWTIHITWKGLRITVWRALSYFVENLLHCSLTALERRSQFWSMSYLVSKNKSIFKNFSFTINIYKGIFCTFEGLRVVSFQQK